MQFDQVLVDLDGVTANFMESAFAAFGKKYCEATWPKLEWGFYKVLGVTEGEAWSKIDSTMFFWENIEPYHWAKELMKLAATRGPVAFLSSPSKHPSCHYGKKKWVDNHFPGVELILCASKHLMAGSGKLLIDDNDPHIHRWREAGGAAVLFPQPWNENHPFIDDRMGYVRTQLVAGTNPKDLVGCQKPPIHLVPRSLNEQVAGVMALGAAKYGPYNWRLKSVKRSIYYDAALRHIHAAIDGEDTDPESGIPHEAHAAACMAIILDAAKSGNLIDDRPATVGEI